MHQAVATDRHADVRRAHHPNCYVCATDRDSALAVTYVQQPNDEVIAEVDCPEDWEGYTGRVHGGIVASLVDGAMTNCLFAKGIVAVTADLHVRYRHPVELGQHALVRAEVVRSSPPLFLLKATIHQNDRLCITATGKFMQQRLERQAPP
jgi:uncharacterized protein (TIGR00369 family)